MAEALTAEFGGEERRFLVLLGELRKVEEKCKRSSAEILHSLARCVQVQKAYPNASLLEQSAIGFGDLRIDDVREPILQGLIGGGLSPNDAGKLVRTWIDERGFQGLVENAWVAWMVLALGWARPEEIDAPGESQAETVTETLPPPGSISPSSTAPEPPWAGRPRRSTPQASGSSPRPSKAGTAPKAARRTSSRPLPPSTTP
jgi:hypothetical protein